MAGKINCLNSNPPDMLLVPGNHFRPNTKREEKITALANSGTEVVKIPNTDIDRSSFEPSFMPDNTPNVNDSGIIIANVQNPNMAVFHNRGNITSATGPLKRIDSPRLPVAKFPSHFT